MGTSPSPGSGETVFNTAEQQGFKYLCLNKLSPSFGVVLNIPVQISELLHGREHLQKRINKSHKIKGKSQCSCAGHLYGSPTDVAYEVNWACDVGSSGEPGCCFSSEEFFHIHPPEEEIQFQRVDLVLHQQDLESHLSREDQLVTLEQTPKVQI